MAVRKGDRVLLPGETRAVTVRGVDRDEDEREVIIFFTRADGMRGDLAQTFAAFDALAPLRVDGTGEARLALAGLWGRWLTRVTATVRQSVVATTPLRAYAHQDEAVFGVMLPQPTLRFLLADEPGTGKTIMTGMYIAEMRRLGLLGRVLLAVPAHIIPKWERDMQRFFGIETERITAEVGRASASLRPDRDTWVTSVDLLARNPQVQAKVILAPEAAWDLVVFDEGHRLTPTAQNTFPMAQALAKRCRHLLLLTATPHRGSEYYFRGLLHLLDPQVYPWSPDDQRVLDTGGQRLRPARIHFLRRMKEHLRDHDNITPLFPPRRAHNVSVPLSATEQELYEESLAFIDRFFADNAGLVRSVYGKRGASSLAALAATLGRRAERLRARPATAELVQALTEADLLDDEATSQEDLERRANGVRSADRAGELVAIDALRERINALLHTPGFVAAKWQEVRENVLPRHGITPGAGEQLLVFTEFADTATWLFDLFTHEGFAVRRYAGDVSRDARDQIQDDFQHKRFEVLISTDAGNEGIDLQSAHVLVNWDIPWSIVRLEQRAGRLHRVGQRSNVDIYNLISTSTREGRVQEVILDNIVAAAEALNGQIFDFLGSVVEHVGLDFQALMVRAGAGDRAADAAVADAGRVTAAEYRRVAEELRAVENQLASRPDLDAFAAHSQQDRLDAVNPTIVTAFMGVLSAARGWRLTPDLYEDVYRLEAGPAGGNGQASTLPAALGGGWRALVAMSNTGLAQARGAGADLAGAVVLGPAEAPYRALVEAIVRDTEDALAVGAILEDTSALTDYELLVFDAAIERQQGGRPHASAVPLLVRVDAAGARAVAWQGIAHLSVPTVPQGAVEFRSGPQIQAEAAANTALTGLADDMAARLRSWSVGVIEQLERLQDDVVEPYSGLSGPERRARRATVRAAINTRKALVESATVVTPRPPRLVGRIRVRAIGTRNAEREDADSEARSMLACRDHLEAQGFQVTDVHQEGCGYDLRAQRGHEQRCVEVKGLKGSIGPGIHLESSEWLMAQQIRDDYWVYIYTECAAVPILFGAYPNPVALFGNSKRLVERFHIPAKALKGKGHAR